MKALFMGGEPQTIEKTQLAVRLRWPDVTMLVAHDLETGLDLLEGEHPDVLFLQDSGVRGRLSLTEAIKEVRRFSEVPLIVLEREGAAADMEEVRALELGADDYIRASAGIIDLVARLSALMRRVWRMEAGQGSQVITCGPLVLNPASYEVFLDGRHLTLTSTEFQLLHLLVKNRGVLVTHRAIELAIWGDHVDRSGVAKKYIQRLRRKLGGEEGRSWIVTVHGVGYRFVGAPDGYKTSGSEAALIG